MLRRLRLAVLAVLTIAGTLALSSGTAMAGGSHGWPKPYTCRGGDAASGTFSTIPSGTYASITVIGACAVAPGAVIDVRGGVYVARGGALDAQSAPSTIRIRHSVVAAPGAFLGLGCQPPAVTGNSAHPCAAEPDGQSDITVRGNVTALGADTVMLNGITVKGNVTLAGGGNPESIWSIKNNVIGRNLVVAGITVNWVGVLFNQIGGNAIVFGVSITDTHPGAAIYVGHNTVGRNLICYRLAPDVSGGFGPPPNIVGGHALGQCESLV